MHCPGGNASNPIGRVPATSDGISSWTPLKSQHCNPNPIPLANLLWCIDFLTPATPLIILHRLPGFHESLSYSFAIEIIEICQSSYKMYNNNILNFQESTTIFDTRTKKSLESYWMHHVSLSSMIKFKSLSHFPLDHLPQNIVSSLLFFFGVFNNYTINRFGSISPNLHLLFCCILSIFALT